MCVNSEHQLALANDLDLIQLSLHTNIQPHDSLRLQQNRISDDTLLVSRSLLTTDLEASARRMKLLQEGHAEQDRQEEVGGQRRYLQRSPSLEEADGEERTHEKDRGKYMYIL